MSGWITNISLGGVAFDYLPTEISIPDYPVVSIYNLKDDSPIVAHLHCRTVHNTLNLSENYMFKHVVDTRHCGLQFIDPTEEDQGRLNRLMSVYQV